MKGKKGSVQDVLMIGMILLVFGVIVLAGFKTTSMLDDQFQASSVVTAEGKAASTKIVSFFPGIMDNMFLILMIGLAIGAFILAAMVRIHPIFIPLYIIALIMIIFFSGVFSNIYQGIATQPDMVVMADQLTFISHILNYLPFIVGIIGTILMIVMYKTWQNAQ